MSETPRPVPSFSLHHVRKRGISRLILLRGGVPLAASQPVPTRELAEWMRRYEIPFTGLIRTGWAPAEDQWPAVLMKWFPDLDRS